ncbi:MAG: hypothetical protein PQJ60_11705, partial [Spirochaetales bacterium]|nr:hypothetical protein [Spirochaetales bacterium]
HLGVLVKNVFEQTLPDTKDISSISQVLLKNGVLGEKDYRLEYSMGFNKRGLLSNRKVLWSGESDYPLYSGEPLPAAFSDVRMISGDVPLEDAGTDYIMYSKVELYSEVSQILTPVEGSSNIDYSQIDDSFKEGQCYLITKVKTFIQIVDKNGVEIYSSRDKMAHPVVTVYESAFFLPVIESDIDDYIEYFENYDYQELLEPVLGEAIAGIYPLLNDYYENYTVKVKSEK